jgi:hypothetical protein
MTNPADILGLGKSVEEGLKLLKEPIQSLLGPAWSELAATWGDGVRHWRDMKRLERALSAVQKLKARGLSPKAVDPSLLFPLLDAASLAADDDLKSRWDNLLANAADPSPKVTILPAFTEILRQLLPLEAKILDFLYDDGLRHNLFEFSSEDVIRGLQITSRDYYNVLATDLHRLQVIDGRRVVREVPMLVHGDGGLEMAEMLNTWATNVSMAGASHYAVIELTHLGWAFVAACRDTSQGSA